MNRDPSRAVPGDRSPADPERATERARMVRDIATEASRTAAWTGTPAFSARVMSALASVPRHAFVPPEQQAAAYLDCALPIGLGQTISQPFVVALMTELARVDARSVVLEVGTGCGYQAAVLAALAARVYSIEIVPELAAEARERLARLGYANVEVREGDGYQGWKEFAPFDAILVTAGAPDVPPPLVEQLAAGGRMLIPVGDRFIGEQLRLVEKDAHGNVSSRDVLPVAFVPLRRSP